MYVIEKKYSGYHASRQTFDYKIVSRICDILRYVLLDINP